MRGLRPRASGLGLLLFTLVSLLPASLGAQRSGRQRWNAQLELAGGPLLFTLVTEVRDSNYVAQLCAGPDCAPATWTREGDSLHITIPDYDAVMVAEVRGDTLDGYYHNVGRLGPRTIPFTATRGLEMPTRHPPLRAGLREMLGTWDATFVTDGRGSPRVITIRQDPRGVEAVVFSNTGDYGRFVGRIEGDSIRFSHFDGSFVFMFVARITGDTLRGTYHAGLRTQTPFTAVRSTGARHLTPPDEMTRADTAPFRFSFRDIDGRLVSSDEPRFRGKVLIVDLFGTWCPTCHDAARALKGLYTRYHARGLEIVGIAYEVTGDSATDGRMVRTFREKIGIPWDLLLAGTPDAASQNATQPQLQNFTAFPTTLFIGRDGRIRRIHAGFYGPATGAAHQAIVRSFEEDVTRLLDER